MAKAMELLNFPLLQQLTCSTDVSKENVLEKALEGTGCKLDGSKYIWEKLIWKVHVAIYNMRAQNEKYMKPKLGWGNKRETLLKDKTRTCKIILLSPKR